MTGSALAGSALAGSASTGSASTGAAGADPVPACTDCGACCWSPDPRWIAVFEADRTRMDERALALTTTIEGRRFMRMEGRCAALDGARCTIYPMRPDACRWLERESSTCRTLIAARRLLRA